MNPRIAVILSLSIIIVSFLAIALAFPHLPDRIVSHWGASGQPDGSMDKFWGLILVPGIMLFIFALARMIPLLDPLRQNIESFRRQYELFWVGVIAFLAYLLALMLAFNFGYYFNFTFLLTPAFALLWYTIGAILQKSRRNWFMGIRTPWTMSSDEVWAKTHELGGKLFKVSAVLAVIGLLFSGNISFIFVIAPPVVTAIVTMVYSYLVYRKISS